MKKQKVIYQQHSWTTLVSRIMCLLILSVLFAFLPEQNAYSFRAATEIYAPFSLLPAPTPAPMPVKSGEQFGPELTAEGVYIVDVPSGMTLYEKNPDIQFLPASTTKIMTALVALEQFDLEDEVTVKTVVTEGQVMGLVVGEVITVENLLYGTLVHSANDAAYVLAEHYPGGVSQFVRLMNEKATELHLQNTHYVNVMGFDDPNQYTTPHDLALLSREALKNHTFARVVSIPQITVADVSFVHFHTLKNVNELLGKIPGIYGIKTGWTEDAGQSLVSIIQRDKRHVLIVLLKSADRFGETEVLLNWIFTNYTWRDIQFAE